MTDAIERSRLRDRLQQIDHSPAQHEQAEAQRIRQMLSREGLGRYRSYLEIVWEKTHPAAVIPKYGHPGDAGFDLVCAVGSLVGPGETVSVPIGLRAELPPAFWVLITSRSSTHDRGFGVVPGIIDAGYRGEWFARLINLTKQNLFVKSGDRLVQGIVFPVLTASMVEGTVDVNGTSRGAGGFGSTGHRSDNGA